MPAKGLHGTVIKMMANDSSDDDGNDDGTAS